MPRDLDVSCSFCGKGRRDVHAIIAGPGVFICDECVLVCSEILMGHAARMAAREAYKLDAMARSAAERSTVEEF